MIKSVNFSLLPSDGLLTFAQRVLRISNGIAAENATLSPFLSKAQTAYENFSSAFERETKSTYTEMLVTKDTARDEAFLALRKYIEACSHRAVEGWNTAANKILDIIRKHGWSAWHEGYKTETAAIDNIVNEINNKCAEEVTLLSATEWITELSTAQAAFEETRNESVTDSTDDAPTISETRPVMEKTLRDLLNITDLLYQSTGDEAILISINALNELIGITMSSARASATRAENQKEDEVSENVSSEDNANA